MSDVYVLNMEGEPEPMDIEPEPQEHLIRLTVRLPIVSALTEYKEALGVVDLVMNEHAQATQDLIKDMQDLERLFESVTYLKKQVANKSLFDTHAHTQRALMEEYLAAYRRGVLRLRSLVDPCAWEQHYLDIEESKREEMCDRFHRIIRQFEWVTSADGKLTRALFAQEVFPLDQPADAVSRFEWRILRHERTFLEVRGVETNIRDSRVFDFTK